MPTPPLPDALTRVRVDVWLWAARFYKTRALCKAAVEAGMVRIDGARIKPSRELTVGMCLSISQGPYKKTVVVESLGKVRQSATHASTMYTETADSVSQRLKQQELQRLTPAVSVSKPSKKQRRAHDQFIERNS